jgi:hypothetical protein
MVLHRPIEGLIRLISDFQDNFRLADVPPGRHELQFWEEHCTSPGLKSVSRPIMVREESFAAGTIRLQQSADQVSAHLNKYRRPFDPQVFSSPIYLKP